MADFLTLIIQIGGVGAVVVIAVAAMGKWLWKKVNATFDSYTTTYFQQKAAIDARIANLENLAGEQARLTRTVESVKDEIAAQAKSRDNRWVFKKDIYCRLITATSELLDYECEVEGLLHKGAAPGAHQPLGTSGERREKTFHDFFEAIALAPLATADEIVTLISAANLRFKAPDTIENSEYNIGRLSELLDALQVAGREDLWGTPEAKAEAAT